MTKRRIEYFILIMIIGVTFFGCDMMATLFHGEKPGVPPVTYTVTFNANGANGTPPETQTVNDGAVIILPDKGGMTSTGNVFIGWNESSSGGGTTYSVGASVTVTRNMVFYAQWIDGSTPQYTVTFNANGATSGSAPASQTVYRGISITVPGQGTLVYSGKTFGGWNTQSNGGGTNYAVGATFTVTENVTLFAKWQSAIQYTVTYNTNGASGTAPSAQTVDPGTEITLPGVGSMSNIGKTFEGWNTQANGGGTSYVEGSAYTVNANTSFYAQWLSVPIEPPGTTLVEKLAYIRNNAGDGVVYDIVVNNNEYIGPQTVSTMGRNITVIIHSASSADVKTIQLEGQGNLFSVDTGITFKLQDIVLSGHSTNNKALIAIGNGTLILYSGAKITGNTNTTSSGTGGGIYVNGGIIIIYDNAEITLNKLSNDWATKGAGIYVENRGTVTMHGGIISQNTTYAGRYCVGGGIFIAGNSSVTMLGGIISKNISMTGGGIYVDSGTFTKRANPPGSGSSGIIYGSSGEDANNASGGYGGERGYAIYRNFGSLKQRNSTLGGYDEISTGNDEGWE